MLYGSVHMCRTVVPLLNDDGRIIHITFIHYERVAQGSSAYGIANLSWPLTAIGSVYFSPRTAPAGCG